MQEHVAFSGLLVKLLPECVALGLELGGDNGLMLEGGSARQEQMANRVIADVLGDEHSPPNLLLFVDAKLAVCVRKERGMDLAEKEAKDVKSTCNMQPPVNHLQG
jgi:hypothetical protein